MVHVTDAVISLLNSIAMERRNTLCCLITIIVALLICAMLGGCKTRQSVSQEHWHHDTAWVVRVATNSKGDSTIYKERIEIVPRIVNVGDTTIYHMDTTIYRYTEVIKNNNTTIYSNQGKESKDSANIKQKKTSPPSKAAQKQEKKLNLLWYGIIIGVIIAIAIAKRKKITAFIKKYIIRMP